MGNIVLIRRTALQLPPRFFRFKFLSYLLSSKWNKIVFRNFQKYDDNMQQFQLMVIDNAQTIDVYPGRESLSFVVNCRA